MDSQILHTIRRHSKRFAQPLMAHGELMLLQLENCDITSSLLPTVPRPAVMPASISAADEHFGERTWRGGSEVPPVPCQQVAMRDANIL